MTTGLSYDGSVAGTNSYITQISDMAVVEPTNSVFLEILPQMITYAENRIYRDLDLLITQGVRNYTLTAGNNLLLIPDNEFVTVQTLAVNSSGSKFKALLPITKEYIRNVYDDISYTALPHYFAMYGGNIIPLTDPQTAQVLYSRTNFLATAGQTTFSVLYFVGFVQLYRNGVLLDTSEYTANDGTTITLNSPAALGDYIDVLAYVIIGGVVPYSYNYFTATAGQTTFVIPYSIGYVGVYINGVLLSPSDYTANNGTSINLNVSTAAGDNVVVIAYTLFTGVAPFATTNYTATASQTTFTQSYNPAAVLVFLNGVLMNTSDYSAFNGTTIVLNVACKVGDIVNVFSYDAITLNPVVYGKTSIIVEVAPTPDASYPVRVSGTVRPLSLSVSNTTTFLSLYFPDLFIMASMIYISAYQRNFGRANDDPQMAVTYESQYDALLKGSIVEEARKKFQSAAWTAYSPAQVATPTR